MLNMQEHYKLCETHVFNTMYRTNELVSRLKEKVK